MHTMTNTTAPAATRTPRHAGTREWWITARAHVNARPAHKGAHGIYRATVTRPLCAVESRAAALVKRARRAVAVLVAAAPTPAPRYALAA